MSRFWITTEGKVAKQWLDAWGRVEYERLVTGDPAAIPACDGSDGYRGPRTNISDIVLRHVEVSRFLACRSPREQQLTRFVYVRARDVQSKVQYQFADGSMTDWQPLAAIQPAMAVNEVYHHTEVDRVDWSGFECEEANAVSANWKIQRSKFFEWMHERIGRALLKSVNVKCSVGAR